jgi:hypothetical protein
MTVVIANLERAGEHAAPLGVVVLIVAFGALVYGLVRFAVGRRASASRSTGPRAASSSSDPDHSGDAR